MDSPRARPVAALAAVVLLLAGAGCGDTSESPAESPSSTSSTPSTMETYHGEFEGKDAAGTGGGDANPEAERDG